MPVEEIGFGQQGGPVVEFVHLKPGESINVAFVENVPGKNSPVTKFTQHYIAEKSGGKYIMCTKGLCCEYLTWNEWEKCYAPSKPKTVFWVPVVLYRPDERTMEMSANVAILALNSFQFGRLSEQIRSCEEGTLPFFERDVKVSFEKNGQYNDYAFIKRETRARYLENPEMLQSVKDQLVSLADDINLSLPPEYTETELAAMIDKWNASKRKVDAEESAQPESAEDTYNNAAKAATAAKAESEGSTTPFSASAAAEYSAQTAAAQPAQPKTEQVQPATVAQQEASSVDTDPVDAGPVVNEADMSLDNLAALLNNPANI